MLVGWDRKLPPRYTWGGARCQQWHTSFELAMEILPSAGDSTRDHMCNHR